MTEVEAARIEELKGIDTPTLSNAVELLGVRNRTAGFADLHLRCLTPRQGVMCGFAVTAQAVTMAPDPGSRERSVAQLVTLCEALQALPGPGIVVIEETGPHPDFAVHCGDVMATLFQRFGGIGIVSDCAVRDLSELVSLDFHVFARGLVASHGHFQVVHTQVPVTICGLRIEPGDLLHGDSNGLITVPVAGRDRLVELSQEVRDRERNLQGFIREEDHTLEQIHDRFVH